MSDDVTARLGLPLLQPGQAQKELWHNEALALADLLLPSTVLSVGLNAPAAAPNPGDAWIVGTSPTGDWIGQAGAVAGWTAGGWRFVAAREGMAAWSVADSLLWRRGATGWVAGELRGHQLIVDGHMVVGPQRGAIADPSGGTTADAQARATLSAILAALRGHGLIAS